MEYLGRRGTSGDPALLQLDYPAYFHLLGTPLPDGRAAILDALLRDHPVAPCEAGGFDITNLGIKTNNKATVSRYIREAVAAGAIKPFDENSPPRLRKYVPFWAGIPANR